MYDIIAFFTAHSESALSEWDLMDRYLVQLHQLWEMSAGIAFGLLIHIHAHCDVSRHSP